MCGIAGIYTTSAVDKGRLTAMTDAIAHRGPDGFGHWISGDARTGLGHRRLSIIDLSENAGQPMHLDGRYTIVFNGEIYNYVELKKDLEADGVVFRTASDTEVLLALYSRYKEKCLSMLDGMFAFVIYDSEEKKLFGARDRFGEKPFYYNYEQGRSFVFCSEIKGLLKYGVDATLNNKVLYYFLSSSHILSDYRRPWSTFYKNIFRLEKASYFTLDSDLKLRVTKYWSLDGISENTSISLSEATEQFRHLFATSITRRLRSDVPVGSSLSGGLDSSSIVAGIQLFGKASSQHTFSARFKNFSRDEGKYIELVTNRFNVQSHYVWPDEEGFFKDLNDLLYYQDEPFGSASIYAQYCVMRKAKEAGVTVLLDGQGADEILAGYEYYLPIHLAYAYKESKEKYDRLYHEVTSLHRHMSFTPLDQQEKTQLPVKINPLLKWLKPKIYHRIVNDLPLPGLFTRDFIYSFSDNNDTHDIRRNLNDDLRHSIEYNNLEDLLRYSDRNSMAHSREVRLPFLSHTLVEFLFSLPVEYKIREGYTKYVLRNAFRNTLPDEIAWRVDKIGYEPPQGKWMENPIISDLADQSFQKLKSNGIIDRKAVLTNSYKWQALSVKNLL